jgi:hypothetical protein
MEVESEEKELGDGGEEGLEFVPEEERMETLRLVHDDLSAGHFGEKKTYELLTRNYWWPGCRKMVKEYVKTCEVCNRGKTE